MNAGTSRGTLHGWTPIIGAFSVWFAHFLIIYAAALIWPDRPLANAVTVVATLIALGMLALLFKRLKSVHPRGEQSAFARRFGMGSLFIATAATLFDAAPALLG